MTKEHQTIRDELRRAYLDGVVSKYGVYGDASEWRVQCHQLPEQEQRYWEERAALRYP